MKSFRERLPEGGESDTDLEAVVNDLERVGRACRTSTVPPQLEARVAHALRARAAEPVRRSSTGWLPRRLAAEHRSLALILVAIVSLIAMVGGAYATVPTLSRVFQMGGAENVLTQNLGTRVNLSQTVAGYTMTVERVYADSNQVLIGYTIRPPATGKRQWNLTPDNLTVATASGIELPNRGYVVASDTGQPDATLQMFDAAVVTGDPDVLHLHLTVPWIDGMEDLQAPARPHEATGGNNGGLPKSGPYGSIATDPANRPTGVPDPYMHDFRVFGPLTFDLTVPVAAGHAVSVHQQVNVGGVTLTLERVVISPTETRAYVKGLNSNQSHYVRGILSGDGWTDEDVDGGSRSVWYANGTTVFSYLGSFTDKQGAMSFAVQSTLSGTESPRPISGGPWTFHFTVG